MLRVLHVVPYPQLWPPQNGGQLRTSYLLLELAKRNHVELVTLQVESGFRSAEFHPLFPESVRVWSAESPQLRRWRGPRTNRIIDGLKYRWIRRSFSGATNTLALKLESAFTAALRSSSFDIVLFEGLDAMLLSPVAARLAPAAVRVLDAQNIDHRLLDEGAPAASHVYALETDLASSVHCFFACSESDKDELMRLNESKLAGFTIPNGVDINLRPFDASEYKHGSRAVIFCGSLDYAPNVDGLRWFYSNVWPRVLRKQEDAHLVIVGRGAATDLQHEFAIDSSVDFVGAVEDVTPYYHRCGISVVPLRRGSGTRLKVLESMSLGNPVVSTSVGAEGIAGEDSKHLFIADTPAEFAKSMLLLMHNPALFDAARREARRLVETTYDWQKIGASADRILNSCRSRSMSGV